MVDDMLELADRLGEERMQEIRETFDSFDRDHNGAIDIGELDQLLLAIGADVNQEELETAIRALDEDGNGRIDFTEFLHWWGDK